MEETIESHAVVSWSPRVSVNNSVLIYQIPNVKFFSSIHQFKETKNSLIKNYIYNLNLYYKELLDEM